MDKTLFKAADSKPEVSNPDWSMFAGGNPQETASDIVVLLNEPQKLALEWLMGGGSVTEAGEYAGVCRQTVSHWLHHDPNFRLVFEKWRQQTQTLNQARLQMLGESALETIAEAIRQKRDAKVALVLLKGLGLLGAPR
jgi:hypothetical protein